MDAPQTNFTMEDTLTQIGPGYGFLFVLGFAAAGAFSVPARQSPQAANKTAPPARLP